MVGDFLISFSITINMAHSLVFQLRWLWLSSCNCILPSLNPLSCFPALVVVAFFICWSITIPITTILCSSCGTPVLVITIKNYPLFKAFLCLYSCSGHSITITYYLVFQLLWLWLSSFAGLPSTPRDSYLCWSPCMAGTTAPLYTLL